MIRPGRAFFYMNNLALVTGAASGLGLEFSRLLASDGFNLIMVDYDQPGLAVAKDSIEKDFKIEIEDHVIDLGKAGAAETIWSHIEKRKIDVLINNAGFGLYGTFTETDWQLEESMINLHVLTVTHLTKLVLKDMVERGSGRIMNTSSLAAFQPGPLMSVYYASKAYILSFSEALAREVKGTGVTVALFAPGWFKTNFQKTTALNSNVEESEAKLHTATAEKVANKAYKAMMAGKTLVIPGFNNKLMSLAPNIIPRRVMTRIIHRIQVNLRK